MLKVTPLGEFFPIVEGLLNGEMPAAGSHIQIYWPDNSLSVHKICAEPPESQLRFILLHHNGAKIGVMLFNLLQVYARYVEVDQLL